MHTIAYTACCFVGNDIWFLTWDGALWCQRYEENCMMFVAFIPEEYKDKQLRLYLMRYIKGKIILFSSIGSGIVVFDIKRRVFEKYNLEGAFGKNFLTIIQLETKLIFPSADASCIVSYDCEKGKIEKTDFDTPERTEIKIEEIGGLVCISHKKSEMVFPIYGTNSFVTFDANTNMCRYESLSWSNPLIYIDTLEDGYLCVDTMGDIYYGDDAGLIKYLYKESRVNNGMAAYNCIISYGNKHIVLPCSNDYMLYLSGVDCKELYKNKAFVNNVGGCGFVSGDMSNNRLICINSESNALFHMKLTDNRLNREVFKYDEQSFSKYKYDVDLCKEGECGRKLVEWINYISSVKVI